MKLNQLILAAIVGAQFVFPAFAADSAATNSTGAAQSESPALTAGGTAASAAETAEIEALKKEIQALDKKSKASNNSTSRSNRRSSPPTRNKSRTWTRRCGFSSASANWTRKTAAAAAKTQPRFAGGERLHLQFRRYEFFHRPAWRVAGGQPDLSENDNVRQRQFSVAPGATRSFPARSSAILISFRAGFWRQRGANRGRLHQLPLLPTANPGGQIQVAGRAGAIAIGRQHFYFNERSLVTDLVPNRDLGWNCMAICSAGR